MRQHYLLQSVETRNIECWMWYKVEYGVDIRNTYIYLLYMVLCLLFPLFLGKNIPTVSVQCQLNQCLTDGVWVTMWTQDALVRVLQTTNRIYWERQREGFTMRNMEFQLQKPVSPTVCCLHLESQESRQWDAAWVWRPENQERQCLRAGEDKCLSSQWTESDLLSLHLSVLFAFPGRWDWMVPTNSEQGHLLCSVANLSWKHPHRRPRTVLPAT